MRHSTRAALLAATAFIATPALAQDGQSGDAPAPAPAEAAGGAQVYTPADFARFAPRTALDMIQQIPGFSIRGTSNQRGIGQASENVLINGERIANKTGGAIEQLSNTPVSSVVKVEVVDASTLGIAGLTGSVANVFLKVERKANGSFEYRPEIRARWSDPNFVRGKLTYNWQEGNADHSIVIDNQANRGAFGGGYDNYVDGDGTLYESRVPHLRSNFTHLNLRYRTKVDLGGDVLNASVAYRPYWYRFYNDEEVSRLDGSDRDRSTRQRQTGFMFNVEGNYEFDLGPGRMKLIGTRFFEEEPTITTVRSAYLDGRPDDGFRFERDAFIGETVLRSEYGWKMGKNDLQISAERATNRLKQNGRLFSLDTNGDFIQQPYPGGSGEVFEERFEGIASFSRPLSDKVDVQLAGGAEYSTLQRVDGDISRSFFRPKGSAVIGWRPSDAWEMNLSAKRTVGQINFYDFLSQPNLQEDRENLGNNELVPPQAWEFKAEVAKNIGAWGKLRASAEYERISDIVDIVPLGDGGEGIGNLPEATRLTLGTNSTIQLDPIGIKGAKFDINGAWRDSNVTDPLTGEGRPISGNMHYNFGISYRHDIPNSDWAYGGFFERFEAYDRVFPTQVSYGGEGPFTGLFVEHKDVMGMTVEFLVVNLTDAPNWYHRTVYSGYRDRSPVLFVEDRESDIGPIFRLSIKGNF